MKLNYVKTKNMILGPLTVTKGPSITLFYCWGCFGY